MIVAINKRKSKNDDNVKNKDEVRNELLSYVQNYFVNSSKASLVTTLNGLYNHEEVNCAKFLMSEWVSRFLAAPSAQSRLFDASTR